MLREYQLKNFKAFANADSLLLKPITLLYGPNSAGKSSIIQSLMLLKQTLEEAEDASVVLLPKGKLVDLGNYREFVHLHQIDRLMGIKVQLDVNPDDISPPEDLDEPSDTLSRIYRFLYSQLLEFPVLSLELEFSVESIRSDISLHRVSLWLGQDDCPVITYEKAEYGLKVSKLYPQHSFWQIWWKEYGLVLSNRVFNQINSILESYNIQEIPSRNRDNTLNELENRRVDVLEQEENQKVTLQNLNDRLTVLKEQSEDINKRKMMLRANQEVPEKDQEKQLHDLKEKIKLKLRERINTRFINFLASDQSFESFVAESEFAEYIDDSEDELIQKRTEWQGEVAKQENIEAEVMRYSQKRLLSDVDDFFKLESLKQKTPPHFFNDEERSLLLEYLNISDDLESLKKHHKEDQQPLDDELKNIEEEINLIRRQIPDLENLRNDNPDIKTAKLLSEITQTIDLLKQLWQRFSNYSQELALEDLLKTLISIILTPDKFSLIKEAELSLDEIEPFIKFEIEFIKGIFEDLKSVRFLLNTTFYASDLLRDFLKASQYLGPMRDYPERFYIFNNSSTKQVGKSGKGSSDLLFEDPLFCQKVNKTLVETFNIGHEVKVVPFQDQEGEPSDVYAIQLIDVFSKVNVSLLDVGFGVSQVLPVIIQSLFASNKTILIEQPEVHIHPRLQTELGDLFIESVKDFGNRFIIETHSEHLMLRLQRQIREGKLSPDDVSVIYVDRSDEGSVCLQLRLDSEGDFIDEWPDGFFEEGYKEMF